MLRIVGINRASQPQEEFILLQNQGSIKVKLRGHAVLGDRAFGLDGNGPEKNAPVHPFYDDEFIFPGGFVMLKTGMGNPKWGQSKDGSRVYFTFCQKDCSLWENEKGVLHVLSTHHTYVERKESQSVLI